MQEICRKAWKCVLKEALINILKRNYFSEQWECSTLEDSLPVCNFTAPRYVGQQQYSESTIM